MHEIVIPFLLALFILGTPFWLAVVWAAARGRQALLGVWILETLLLIALLSRQGFDAWTNRDLFSEPGEWMTIQIVQCLAVCIWVIASGYAVKKLVTQQGAN